MSVCLVAPLAIATLLSFSVPRNGQFAALVSAANAAQENSAAPQTPAQPTTPEKTAERSKLFPPSVVFGDMARIDVRVKLQTDERTFHPDLRRVEGFEFRRARVGIEGNLRNSTIEFELEYDFREEDYPVRDAFVDVRASRAVQIRGGKFKLPFSRDELTGIANLDFAFRSRAADQLAPGRSFGGMVHGRLFQRRVQYQVGLFREDGENGRRDPVRLDDRSEPPLDLTRVGSWRTTATWAARSTVEVVKDLEIGAAMTLGDVPEGRNGLRGRTVFGGSFFPRLDVNGRRQRLGVEAAYDTETGSIQAEWIRVHDQRLGQGFDDEDLDPIVANGWYLAGTWLVLGPKPDGGENQAASRLGAIELTARVEGLRFGGPVEGSEPSRSPRAAVIVPNAERVWTFGANWYVNRFMKVLGNVIREQLDEAVRAPIPGQPVYWSAIARFQFVL